VLFNSYEYILFFLPVVGATYFFLLRFKGDIRVVWLTIASLYFYSDWALRYLPLLLSSALGNFLLGRLIETAKGKRGKIVLFFGVFGNISILLFYKYTNFIVHELNANFHIGIPQTDITLPIGISFFTFTQIAYLVDLSRCICGRYDIWRYVLFVSFFPHLLAGPILHHREMMPQFARRLGAGAYERHIAIGLLIFSMGLFKKVCLADTIAPYANAAFNAAEHGQPLSPVAAWWGALAYTFQLYFDFSGYSDMAIGSARLFGIKLPLNFNAPYSATCIIDFWRRWHMTLSRFLRDYLYFSLGGNRLGPRRRYLNLMITMILGGVWHGAGYGFALWGFLHGAYLTINHAWRSVRGRLSLPVGRIEIVFGGALTFAAVVVGWVFFRAPTVDGALLMLSAMAGKSQTASEDVLRPAYEALQFLLQRRPSELILGVIDLNPITLPAHPVMGSVVGLFWLPLLLAFSLFGPTSQQLAMGILQDMRSAFRLRRARAVMATSVLCLVFLISLSRLNHVTEFLYFQF